MSRRTGSRASFVAFADDDDVDSHPNSYTGTPSAQLHLGTPTTSSFLPNPKRLSSSDNTNNSSTNNSSGVFQQRLQGHRDQAAALQLQQQQQQQQQQIPALSNKSSPSPKPFEFLGVVDRGAVRDFGKMKAEHGAEYLFRAADRSEAHQSASAALGLVNQLEERVSAVLRREKEKEDRRKSREQEQLQRDAREIEGWMAYHKQREALDEAAAIESFHCPFGGDDDGFAAGGESILSGGDFGGDINSPLDDTTFNTTLMRARSRHGGISGTLPGNAAATSIPISINNLRQHPTQTVQALAQGGPVKALSHLRNLSPCRRRKMDAEFSRIEHDVTAKRIAAQKKAAEEAQQQQQQQSKRRRESPIPFDPSSNVTGAAEDDDVSQPVSSSSRDNRENDSNAISFAEVQDDVDDDLQATLQQWQNPFGERDSRADSVGFTADGSSEDASSSSGSDSDESDFAGGGGGDYDGLRSEVSGVSSTSDSAFFSRDGQRQQQHKKKPKRDRERDFIEVSWRLEQRVIFTNMLVCEHEESVGRNALCEQEDAHWDALMRFFVHGCQIAAIHNESKRLLEIYFHERDGWFCELISELDELRVLFVAEKAKIRKKDMYTLFLSCDEPTQQMLLQKTEAQRENFLDMLLEERYLKEKVSHLKRRSSRH